MAAATTGSLLTQTQFQFSHPPLSLFFPSPSPSTKLISHPQIFRSPLFSRPNGKGPFVPCPYAAVSAQAQGTFDPELRSVLELATDSELYELERILFGPSYFSPLLKSITKPVDVDYFMIEEDPKERDDFIAILESRFLFLAADARFTLRGWRPSYRNVLLGVREKLKVPCSSKLSTEDLEAEIFLHLLQEYPSDEPEMFPSSRESSKIASSHGSLELGLSQWKVQATSALWAGAAELRGIVLKVYLTFSL
ncbi:DNA ligase [Actinidia chinensis var. chinensis]|uniref:DNA ligase n=1 Tax=Actinidia chinensis var. chinensis TaxID=1590841 RepID=A0A2R6QID1_ACTCC|nr:DNA ligase [Actinidia chinensis var. chinensis]